MADTPSVLPAGAKPAAPATPAGDQSARVIALPDKLLSNPRGVRIEGEVVRQNNDGSTRIRTDAGTIDIQIKGRQPEAGTRVQIDIPAGNPPRQVTVRPAPEQAQPPQPQQPAPPPVQTAPPAQAPAPAPARPIPAPVPLPPTSATPAPPPTTQPLPEQTSVRLTPATPAQVQAAIQQTLASVTTLPASVTTTAFTANLIAQAAPDTLASDLINTVRPATPLIATPATPALATLPPLPSASLPGAAFLSQPAPMPGQTASPVGITLTPAAQAGAALPVIPAPGGQIPFQPMSAFMTPAVTTEIGIALKPIAMLDVVVTKITLPSALLTPATPTPGQPAPAPGIAQPSVLPAQGQTGPAQPTPHTLTATVIGTTPQGQPMVSLPLSGGLPQTFILQFPASNLPIGSQVQIVPQPGQAMPGTPAITPAPLTPLTAQLPLLQGSRWPVLSELMQTLQQAEPDLAQAVARALPSPASPRAMPAAALLFLAAAKAGDLTAWLGDKKIEALQRLGRSGLLGRLGGDGQQMARMGAEPLSNTDWRAVPLPMYWDSEIQKAIIYFKRDQDFTDREQNGGEQTRFIFDLSLTRMGDVQIDGLMRGKRLDLIVRSQSPFSQSMQAHMRQLYSNAIEDVSLNGELSFQGDPRQWVQVLTHETHFGANA